MIELDNMPEIQERQNSFSEAFQDPPPPIEEVPNTIVDDNDKTEVIEENIEDNSVPRETLLEEPDLPEDWKYPEHMDTKYVPPEKFTDEKEELQWFKKNYRKVIDYHNSDVHVKTLAEKYQDYLIEKEGKVDELKAIQKMLDDDPSVAFKMYAPKLLNEIGAQHKLTDTEMAKLTKEQLSKEFGEDYEKHYSPTDANNTNTTSGKMFARQQEIRENLDKLNKEIDEKVSTVKILSPEEKTAILDKEYTEFKDDFTRDEFNDFVKEANEYVKSGKLNYSGLHLLINNNDYIEEAFKKGVEYGKKSLTEDLEKAGGAKIEHSPDSTKNGKLIRRQVVFDERHPDGTEKFFNPFNL